MGKELGPACVDRTSVTCPQFTFHSHLETSQHSRTPWIFYRQYARKAVGKLLTNNITLKQQLIYPQRRPRRVQMGRRQERCAARKLPGPLAHGPGRSLAARPRLELVCKRRRRIQGSRGCADQGREAQAEGGRGGCYAGCDGPAGA